MKSLSSTVSGPSMIDSTSHPSAPSAASPTGPIELDGLASVSSTAPGERALPEAPRDGFELGAIDVSAERPSHGLAADRSTRWLVGGLVGGSLLLAGIITLVRGSGDADATPSGDGIELQAALGDPLRASMLALEAVRMEAITISTVRALADGEVEATKSAPRRPARTVDGATPAATVSPGTRSSDTARGRAAPTIDELPPPPPEPEAGRDDATATPPSQPAPAETPPTDDAAEPDEASDAPSGV